MNHSITKEELLKIFPDIKIVCYNELADYDNIDEILYPTGAFIILYLTTSMNSGHWDLVFVRDKKLHFFDSYGFRPDSNQNNYVSGGILDKSNQAYSLLLRLMKDSRYKKVYFNDFKFQGLNTSTCGRWCLMRLILRELTDEEFIKFIKLLSKKCMCKYDELIVALSNNYLKK